MTDDTDERGEEYVARQRGGDHLPECLIPDPGDWVVYMCICDRLRACEARVERVTREDDNRALWDNRQWNAALDSARDAVAALSKPDFHWANATDGQCGIEVGYEHALAAIDALRGAE
jgi:hypothetical protein